MFILINIRNSDDDLSFQKTLTMYNVAILIENAFNKYHHLSNI